jgi:hypothetical protein
VTRGVGVDPLGPQGPRAVGARGGGRGAGVPRGVQMCRRDMRQLISDCIVASGHVPELESIEVAFHTSYFTDVCIHLRVGALVLLGDLIHDQLGIT